MNDPLTIFFIAALAVVVIAVLITRALVRSKLTVRYKSEIARLEAEVDHVGKEKDAVIEAREKAHEEAMGLMRQGFDEAMSSLKAQAKEATDELLKARQKEFKETGAEAISTVIAPLKQRLDDLRKEMSDNTVQNKTSREAIGAEVKRLMEYTSGVAARTEELTAAFKYGNKVQGIWGETILEELLSSQGLTRGIHFDSQAHIAGKDSETGIPDVIIHLDRRREVIVDSKTSMTAYLNYVNAGTEEERIRYLKQHIASIRTHVNELSRKDYSSLIKPPKVSAGYVIMFVPNMGALWAALNAEPQLWREAAEKNVYIADEQSLYGAIRIVQLTWTQVLQAENHEAVFQLADEMVDRVDKFIEYYEGVGKSLESALKAYGEGQKKLGERGQSIVVTARKLTKLGAKKGRLIESTLQDVDEII